MFPNLQTMLDAAAPEAVVESHDVAADGDVASVPRVCTPAEVAHRSATHSCSQVNSELGEESRRCRSPALPNHKRQGGLQTLRDLMKMGPSHHAYRCLDRGASILPRSCEFNCSHRRVRVTDTSVTNMSQRFIRVGY